jgi:hypothetical protein
MNRQLAGLLSDHLDYTSSRMKVVLFCGGLGTRIREYSENIPKPMIPVGLTATGVARYEILQ